VKLLVLSIACVCLLAAGCGDDGDAYVPPELVHVLADEAIRQPMLYIGHEWQRTNPQRVTFDFATTPALLERAAGTDAVADVLVTDNRATINRAKSQGLLASDPVAIATNRLVLGVPTIDTTMSALTDAAGTRWIRCEAATRCGQLTDALLRANDFTDDPYLRTEPLDVLPRVTSGRASAGVMWASEALEAGSSEQIRLVEIPQAESHVATYFIAPLKSAKNPDVAQGLVDLATSARGRQLIQRGKFTLP